MATIRASEMWAIEQAFGLRSGLVLDFGNKTFKTYVYHAGGAGGPAFAGGVLMRTRASTESTPTNWATQAGSATHAERFTHASDMRGNVAAIMSDAGRLIEQYRYSATGVPLGLPKGDVNGDGAVGGKLADLDYVACVSLDTTSTAYQVRGDLDLDGDVDASDWGIVSAEDGVTANRKDMTAVAVKNRHGPRGQQVGGEPQLVGGKRLTMPTNPTPEPERNLTAESQLDPDYDRHIKPVIVPNPRMRYDDCLASCVSRHGSDPLKRIACETQCIKDHGRDPSRIDCSYNPTARYCWHSFMVPECQQFTQARCDACFAGQGDLADVAGIQVILPHAVGMPRLTDMQLIALGLCAATADSTSNETVHCTLACCMARVIGKALTTQVLEARECATMRRFYLNPEYARDCSRDMLANDQGVNCASGVDISCRECCRRRIVPY